MFSFHGCKSATDSRVGPGQWMEFSIRFPLFHCFFAQCPRMRCASSSQMVLFWPSSRAGVNEPPLSRSCPLAPRQVMYARSHRSAPVPRAPSGLIPAMEHAYKASATLPTDLCIKYLPRLSFRTTRCPCQCSRHAPSPHPLPCVFYKSSNTDSAVQEILNLLNRLTLF